MSDIPFFHSLTGTGSIELSVLSSMTIFALVASITPGPVNLVGLSSGARYKLPVGLIFITGATLGFVVLFIAIGLGLYQVMQEFPALNRILQWGGVAFLLWLSYLLIKDNGEISEQDQKKAPGFMTGAGMQWLNPKAWLASASGIAAHTASGELNEVLIFAAIYLPICWLSLLCWVYAGAFMRQYVHNAGMMRVINRSLAGLLILSCGLILLEG
ncbi:LysE family translocator [Oceanospirillum sp.]|uniref:LysE family translocator n=1 Tax=Oceanospirillum sp. TaxID=2021254 RepID=UPI003A94DB45